MYVTYVLKMILLNLLIRIFKNVEVKDLVLLNL